ncbi:hypothetical protein BDP27DRAFT_1376001 [Rhodocollybia butyracea]|uniref:Uncharacterized protein n=1 Tax=Rhodocollybia butyracea TaxID=206335 RepID=A0A9P5P3J4_9AGAR|nr:hypothetical protein BDP27DRAFT_1376001 [Rhodocollybia butyracea]
MSVRAYYLPANPASAIDASHPVSIEQLDALGWKILSVRKTNICVANGGISAITGGSGYFDLEDVTTAGWVRIHVVPGTLIRVPTGAKYRVPFNEQNRGVAGIIFFKETIFNIGLLVKGEIDNHPARRSYLNAQALGKA